MIPNKSIEHLPILKQNDNNQISQAAKQLYKEIVKNNIQLIKKEGDHLIFTYSDPLLNWLWQRYRWKYAH